MFKIALLESLPTPVSTHTSLLSGSLSIGCLFNSILYLRLPYWCTSSLHSDYPKYFVPFLKPRIATLVYKSTKHFGLSFAYDAPMIWNDLPDDVYSVTSRHSLRKKLKTYLFEKAYPPIVFVFPILSL